VGRRAVENVQLFFADAVSAGVKRLIFLSGRGEVEAEQADQVVKESGADWTILRCSFFLPELQREFLS
jgi:uncharacterized protein YbjT (DUF2867 family)